MEDWDNFAEFEETHYVDNEYAREGHGALRVEDLNYTEATIYEPSIDAETASSEGRIKTWIRKTEAQYIGLYLRFVDVDNHYWVGGGRWWQDVANGGFRGSELRLYRTQNGETELINSVEFETFSDGDGVRSSPSWVPFRVTWFIDDMGGFRVWVQEDAIEAEEWHDVGGTLVDPDPILGPGSSTIGSGIGFGGNTTINDVVEGNSRSHEDGLWYDQTEIYYDE